MNENLVLYTTYIIEKIDKGTYKNLHCQLRECSVGWLYPLDSFKLDVGYKYKLK